MPQRSRALRTKDASGGLPGVAAHSDCPLFGPELFELERQRLWSKTWLYAGFANELPQAGSFKLWENAGISVILIRGRDLKVRAFYNTCRHRGGALVREECGRSRALVCKFHAWTYDLEGTLKHVPGEHDFPGLDKATHGLVPLRCELWGNMIFVNRDQAAPPLLEWLGPLVDDFADLSMDTRTAFDVRTYEMPCNWKIAIDAFVESYHLAQVHPQTVCNYVDHRGSHIDLYDNGHSTITRCKRLVRRQRSTARWGPRAATNTALGGRPSAATPCSRTFSARRPRTSSRS